MFHPWMPWQDYLALAVFAAAAAAVVRRAYRAIFGAAKPGCGSGCGGCPSGRNPGTRRADQFLSIGAPPGASKR